MAQQIIKSVTYVIRKDVPIEAEVLRKNGGKQKFQVTAEEFSAHANLLVEENKGDGGFDPEVAKQRLNALEPNDKCFVPLYGNHYIATRYFQESVNSWVAIVESSSGVRLHNYDGKKFNVHLPRMVMFMKGKITGGAYQVTKEQMFLGKEKIDKLNDVVYKTYSKIGNMWDDARICWGSVGKEKLIKNNDFTSRLRLFMNTAANDHLRGERISYRKASIKKLETATAEEIFNYWCADPTAATGKTLRAILTGV